MGKVFLFVLAPLSGLMLFCLAAWLSRKVRGCSVWTLPRSVLVALAVLALVAVDFAQKGGAPSLPPSPVPPPLPMGAGTGVTNSVLITAIVPTPSNVTLSAEWPEELAIPGTLDVFFSPTLTNLWEWIGEVNVPSGATNLTFTAEAADLPGAPDAMPAMGFFRLGSFADTDGDGLDDEVETGVSQFSSDAPFWYPYGMTFEEWRRGWREYTATNPPGWDATLILPAPIITEDATYVKLSVDRNGVFNLYTNTNYTTVYVPQQNHDLECYGLCDSVLTVAPLWAPLTFGTQSVIRVYQRQGDILNVEYERMRLAGTPDAPENEASVQVWLGLSQDGRLVAECRYVDVGSNVCSAASIGFRSPGGRWRQTYSFRGSQMFSQGALDFWMDTGSGSDPHRADTDGDGLMDGAEMAAGTDPGCADMDLDGLSDGEEAALGTDPRQPDTDGDGLDDGWEAEHGFNPTVDNVTDSDPGNDADADPDGDGLSNAEECIWHTSPYLVDSDGDGMGDGAEVSQNSDPNDADDEGEPDSRVPVNLYFGDDSGSNSEKYRLTLTPVPGSGPGVVPDPWNWLNARYGAGEWRTAMLKPGWLYEVALRWAACRCPPQANVYPNYDYTLEMEGNPRVLLDDPGQLFRIGYYGSQYYGNSSFPVLDVTARICVLELPDVDAPVTVGVNGDDDDGNGTPDMDDSGEVVGEDDLAEVTVRVSCPPGYAGTATVTPYVNPNAGTLWRDRARTEAVGQQDTFGVSGTAERTYYLEGCGPSSRHQAERLHVELRCGTAVATNEHIFTFIERVVEPVTSERSGGQVVNPCCAVVGAAAPLRVKVRPESYPDSEIRWSVVSGAGSFSDGGTGREVSFTAGGAPDQAVKVQIDCGDCPGAPPQLTLRTTVMHDVKIYPCAISRMGRVSPVTLAHVGSLLEGVNAIYRQVGMHFSLGAGLMSVTNSVWARQGLVDASVGSQIRNVMSGTDGLEIYFIHGLTMDKGKRVEPMGSCSHYGIIVKDSVSPITLAHEIGHACGWHDIYVERNGIASTVLSRFVKQEWLPSDWNNGTGRRFYDPLLMQDEVVRRLLMFGTNSGSKSDLPAGGIYGLSEGGSLGIIGVGRDFMTLSPRSL